MWCCCDNLLSFAPSYIITFWYDSLILNKKWLHMENHLIKDFDIWWVELEMFKSIVNVKIDQICNTHLCQMKVIWFDNANLPPGGVQQGVLRGPGPPIFWKKCAQFSEKGDFVIFTSLLGPPQYFLCCACPDIGVNLRLH